MNGTTYRVHVSILYLVLAITRKRGKTVKSVGGSSPSAFDTACWWPLPKQTDLARPATLTATQPEEASLAAAAHATLNTLGAVDVSVGDARLGAGCRGLYRGPWSRSNASVSASITDVLLRYLQARLPACRLRQRGLLSHFGNASTIPGLASGMSPSSVIGKLIGARRITLLQAATLAGALQATVTPTVIAGPAYGEEAGAAPARAGDHTVALGDPAAAAAGHSLRRIDEKCAERKLDNRSGSRLQAASTSPESRAF